MPEKKKTRWTRHFYAFGPKTSSPAPTPPEGYIPIVDWTATANGYYQTNPTYQPSNVLDNNSATFWHSIDNAGVGSWIAVDMQSAQYFDFVDFVPRQGTSTDPKLIALEVSNDGINWTTSSTTWISASNFSQKRVPASALHYCRYFRFRFLAVYTAAVAIAELKPGVAAAPGVLYDFGCHEMTSYTSPSPYVASASSYYVDSNGGEPWKAFDGLHGQSSAGAFGCWVGVNNGTDWLQLDIGTGRSKKLFSYAITMNIDSTSPRMPKNWTMQGSNNGTTWDILDTVVNQTGWVVQERRLFDCDVINVAYRYFRLNITANNGDGVATQVAELELFTLRS